MPSKWTSSARIWEGEDAISYLPFTKVFWCGLEARLDYLEAMFWDMKLKLNHYTNTYTFQMREPESKMLGSVKFKMTDEFIDDTAFLKVFQQEHNGRTKPPKILEREDLDESHISEFYALILQLQKSALEKYKKQPEIVLPTGEVIDFMEYLNNNNLTSKIKELKYGTK